MTRINSILDFLERPNDRSDPAACAGVSATLGKRKRYQVTKACARSIYCLRFHSRAALTPEVLLVVRDTCANAGFIKQS